MKTIVAAIDTSKISSMVFRETLVLASTIRAKVVVVSVTPNYEGNMNRFCIDDAEKEFNEPFKKALEDAIEYAASLGLELQTIHRTGKPSDEILAVAQEQQASLIVLGCTNRHYVERMLLGRTTAEIIENSQCDVLLLPENSTIRITNVLVGVSGSDASRGAAKRAFDVARSYGSRVHGLMAIDLPTDRSLRFGVAQDAESKAKRVLQNFISHSKSFEIPVTTAITWSTAEKGLVNYAEENGIDLIILGSNGKKSFLEMLGGSVVERLASLTNCPVLIANYLPERSERASTNCAFMFED